jgi:hypothetical protein
VETQSADEEEEDEEEEDEVEEGEEEEEDDCEGTFDDGVEGATEVSDGP